MFHFDSDKGLLYRKNELIVTPEPIVLCQIKHIKAVFLTQPSGIMYYCGVLNGRIGPYTQTYQALNFPFQVKSFYWSSNDIYLININGECWKWTYCPHHSDYGYHPELYEEPTLVLINTNGYLVSKVESGGRGKLQFTDINGIIFTIKSV